MPDAAAARLNRLGGALIALGVLAWAPFLAGLALGRALSLWPFLAVHLAGVLGGAALRRRARALGGGPALPLDAPGRRRALAGRVLVLLGVLAWAPYLYQHNVLHAAIAIRPYLAMHLTGVLGGSALLASAGLSRYRARRATAE